MADVMATPEMGKKISALVLLAAAFMAALLTSACGAKSNGSSTAATVTGVTVTPTSTTDVPINTSFDFTATVTLSDTSVSTTTAVTWFVNGIAGGNSTIGTIVPLNTDNQVGVYTAPGIVPAVNNGQVNITATAQQSASCTTNCTITSNTVVVQITVVLGLTVSPSSANVAAGSNFQFTAIKNGVADPSASWTVTSTGGGNIGSISLTGLYSAPPFPPPGTMVTITAKDNTDPANPLVATATATIFYSDQSFKGPYAFSYVGNDASGFLAVAGSFNADGSGHITSGVEDGESFLSGVFTQVAFVPPAGSIFPGTYVVGPDGRVTATVNTARGTTETWQFALTTNQHALMIRFNMNVTGSGTIDQQSAGDLANPNSLATGSYVFSVSGTDTRTVGAVVEHNPLAMAGMFTADGSGDIPNPAMTNTIADITNLVPTLPAGFAKVDSEAVVTGSYAFDGTFPGTGRGTLTLTNATTGTLEFAFYSFAGGMRLHIVEIDGAAGRDFLTGDVYSAPGASSLNLAAANYAFTQGGNSSSSNFAASYAAGGVFASNGGGTITGGIFDSNNAGTLILNTTLNSCAYTVTPSTGRIDLKLCQAAGNLEYAVYQTSQGSALMIELGPAAISTGVAFVQSTTAALAGGNFALNLAGQGVFRNAPALYQQNVDGALALSAFTGNLDIDIFGDEPFESDPISAAASSIAQPNGATGRGTTAPASNAPFILDATNPDATFNLIYYVIDANTALLLDQDKSFQLTGVIARQF